MHLGYVAIATKSRPTVDGHVTIMSEPTKIDCSKGAEPSRDRPLEMSFSGYSRGTRGAEYTKTANGIRHEPGTKAPEDLQLGTPNTILSANDNEHIEAASEADGEPRPGRPGRRAAVSPGRPTGR